MGTKPLGSANKRKHSSKDYLTVRRVRRRGGDRRYLSSKLDHVGAVYLPPVNHALVRRFGARLEQLLRMASVGCRIEPTSGYPPACRILAPDGVQIDTTTMHALTRVWKSGMLKAVWAESIEGQRFIDYYTGKDVEVCDQ